MLIIFNSVIAINEYEFEVIEEFIPKTITSSNSDTFFKYHLSCSNEKKETNIYFQSISNSIYYVSLYDDLTQIHKDINGYYTNFKDFIVISYDYLFSFNHLTCNKDYYFIIYKTLYNEEIKNYFQFSIINEETNILNLSPSLSLYYILYPRKSDKAECLFYLFKLLMKQNMF